jgi:hypothetical protein
VVAVTKINDPELQKLFWIVAGDEHTAEDKAFIIALNEKLAALRAQSKTPTELSRTA